MIQLEEGGLTFSFPDAKSGFKFDEQDSSKPEYHGLSHCMKAVDFVIETKDRWLFVEIKDPPVSNPCNASRKQQELVNALVTKFRDSLLYRWAEEQTDKPIVYHCLVNLDSALTLQLTTALKRALPEAGPKNGRWKRPLAVRCAVANVRDWNQAFPKWKVNKK